MYKGNGSSKKGICECLNLVVNRVTAGLHKVQERDLRTFFTVESLYVFVN